MWRCWWRRDRGGEAADATEEEAEVFAVDVFHREEGEPVGLGDVVDADDVGMGDLTCEANLGAKAFEAGGIDGDFWREEFERDGGAELEIVGAIDLAHAALAQEPDDAIAIGEGLAWLEAAG
jgi:hypothetical protein